MSAKSLDIVQSTAVYRDYSAEFKAKALVALKANDNNILRTAHQLDIPEPTLRRWIANGGPRDHTLQERKSADLANEFEDIAFQVTGIARDRLSDPDKADKINFQQLMTGGGIAVDKMRILRELPTSIIGSTGAGGDLSELLSAVANIAQAQQLTESDAALRLAAQLSDVPELAAMLREWAEGEQERRKLDQPQQVVLGNEKEKS